MLYNENMKIKYPIKTKYGEFQAMIWRDKKERVYFVSIPAFPGVLTEARTLAEAKKYAREVIELQSLEALDGGKILVDDTMRVYGKAVRAGAFSVTA
jgi:predicted RNase H-like HicB family nuclease